MKKILFGFSAIALISFLSCSSGGEKKAEESAVTIPADSSIMMMVRFPVADYSAFNAIYLSHDSLRDAFGISKFMLGREMEDSSKVIVLEKIADVARAKEFSTSPVLKEGMDQAGISGAPAFDYFNVIRNDNSPIAFKDRVMIKHRVKDFDAWLKVYDAEGMAARAENGMIDRGLARGADDPNIVYIVFAISDMAKAQARSSSPELQAKMMEAGVEGPPEIVMYTIQD